MVNSGDDVVDIVHGALHMFYNVYIEMRRKMLQKYALQNAICFFNKLLRFPAHVICYFVLYSIENTRRNV